MARDLAAIDALSLIHEKATVVMKCITVDGVNPMEIQTLAYIARDFLHELGQGIQRL